MAAGWTDPRGASGGLEADYLERVADDLQLILGADIGIDAVEIVDVEPGTGADGRGAGEPGTEGARIALRARYLVRSMSVRWFTESDSTRICRID